MPNNKWIGQLKGMRRAGRRSLRDLPLRYKLIVLFLLIGIVPSLGLGLLVNWTVERIVERQIEENTMQLIGKVNETLDSRMENLQNMTYLIGFQPQVAGFMEGGTVADGYTGEAAEARKQQAERMISAAGSRNDLYEIKQYLQGFTTLYPEIAGIMLVNEHGDYISNEMYARDQRNLTAESWYRQAERAEGIFTIIGHPADRGVISHVSYRDNEIISVARSYTDPQTGKALGVVLIDLKLRAISHAARDVTLGKTGYLMVADEDGSSIYIPERPLIEQVPSEVFNVGESGSLTRSVGGEKLLLMYRSSSFTGWRTIGVFPAHEAAMEVRQIQFYVFCFLFVACLIGIGASLTLSRSIADPIRQLMASMRHAETGDLTIRNHSERGDEIGMLERSFNRMLTQIRRLMSLNELKERQKREAELRSLQAHIKPHFLYNTLDTIHWMARKKGAEDVAEMVEALSRLFRIGLSKGEDMIRVQEEMTHIESYLRIQKTRYRDRLTCEMNVPDEIGHLYVLKLLLQPIVENAIYHGIKARRGPGKIRIEAKTVDDRLLLVVTDNGAGMAEDRLRELKGLLEHPLQAIEEQEEGRAGRSYGMLNVQARIRLAFGDEYGIRLESEPSQGTRVTIVHPLLHENVQKWGREESE
ncbi:sensor histidine kinase [Paenibacillus sp. P96]|uniref:Sensor histidine kinase n=1 Tax=Paenibacillus zeirhizosphaerae TaxID=2987519 RepID=A0ABT9FWB9_9BACL|nr:sensor histidine kinase [Paenibacillus sp. P96]MDP4099021.1 sensor histidine kinase [Paenibacillus sp. P96]